MASLRRGGDRGRARATAVLIVMALVLVSLGLSPSPAAAQVEGLGVDGTTTYRLDVSGGVVHVTVELDLVNTMPSRTRGNYVETPYFDSFTIPTMGPVVNATATSSTGRDLAVDLQASDHGIVLVVVDLSPNLVHGTPQSMTVEFDLPGQPSRSDSVTRVNDAFASWFVLGPGDAGRTDILIDVPDTFSLSLTRDVAYQVTDDAGRRVFRFERLANPDDAVFVASVRDDSRLAERTVSASGARITIASWPDDTEWADFTAQTIERGLPTLQRLVGMDLPREELRVVESSSAYHLGYAGFYVPALGVIEIGDELDEQVVLHELSHVWFNHHLFTDRWIVEGLAEEVSHRALPEPPGGAPTPGPVDREAPGAVALNDWSDVDLFDPAHDDAETFGYHASYAVVHALVDEIGLDALRDVIAAAFDRDIAYQGDPDPEKLRVAGDWRYFYDLLEQVGGSQSANRLFVDHVLTEEQTKLLRRRAGAQASLATLSTAGDGWTPPLAVRQAMAHWRFDQADELIDQAHELLDRARSVNDTVDALDLDPVTALETAYERAGDLDELDDAIGEYEGVGTGLLALSQRRETAGPLARLGLVGSGRQFDDAGAALVVADLDEARMLLAQASGQADGATSRGIAVAVALALLVLSGVALVRTRRHARSHDGS